MRKQKPALQAESQPPLLSEPKGRRPWVKKSPVEAVINQIDRQLADVEKKERELNEARRELKKLEEVRKILEEK